jgi:hypothetical protein
LFNHAPGPAIHIVGASWLFAGICLGAPMARLIADLYRHARWRRPMGRVRVEHLLASGALWNVIAALVLLALLATYLRTPLFASGLSTTRVLALSSGVSPTLPFLLLHAVLYLFSLWNLRRLKMHAFSQPNGWWITRLLSGEDPDLRRRLQRSALEFTPEASLATLTIVLPIAAAVVAIFGGWTRGTTSEGLAFSRLLWWGSVFATVAMAQVAARAANQGALLSKALAVLHRHDLHRALPRIAQKQFDWRLSLMPQSRHALDPLVKEVRLLLWTPGLLVSPTDEPGLAAERRAVLEAIQPLAARDPVLKKSDKPIVATKEWKLLLGLGSALVNLLEAYCWTDEQRARRPHPDASASVGSQPTASESATAPVAAPGKAAGNPPAAGPAAPVADAGPMPLFERAELIVGIVLAFVIRNLLARVVSSLMTALVGFTLVLFAHLLFAFQGRHFWLVLDLTCLTATAVIAVVTLVRFERDHVLSTLWSTSPGRVSWTGGFIYRIAVTGALPIILILASMFPEVGGSILGLLEPIQKALP